MYTDVRDVATNAFSLTSGVCSEKYKFHRHYQHRDQKLSDVSLATSD
jgi:hypothetical protein